MEILPLFLLLALLGTGLIGGLFLTLDNSVLPGLSRLPDTDFIRVFYRVSQAIRTPLYSILFLGAHLAQLLAFLISFLSGHEVKIYLLLAAAVSYGVGVIGVSMKWIVPLHTSLGTRVDRQGHEKLPENFRRDFQARWKRYNRIRAFAAILSFLLLLTSTLLP